MSKTNKNILTSILSICIILAAFLGSVNFWCYNEDFYTKEHSKIQLYGKSISEHIGINDDELKDLTRFVLDYLNDKQDSLDKVINIKGKDREVFTDDEKAHMIDVKILNLNARLVLITSIFLAALSVIMIYFNKVSVKDVYYSYKRIIIYALTVFAFIGLWILIDFDSFWNFFHHIFFAGNELWILDLRTDILIMIVPPDFFNDLVIRILITFILTISLVYFVLYLIQKKVKDD